MLRWCEEMLNSARGDIMYVSHCREVFYVVCTVGIVHTSLYSSLSNILQV